MIRPATLVVAAVLASPALWQGFVTGTIPVSSALERYLLAVLVSAVMMAAIRALTDPYRAASHRRAAQRRAAEAARKATEDDHSGTPS